MLEVPPHDDERWARDDWRTERLRTIAHAYELTHNDVAQLVGVSTPTVSQWVCRNPDKVIPVLRLRLLMLELARP